MSDKIKCNFSAPSQLCGKMKVNSGKHTGEYCSLPAGECPHQECEVKPKQQDASEIFTQVIEFAIQTDSSKEFLQCWLEGDFKSIKDEWPEFKGYVGESIEDEKT